MSFLVNFGIYLLNTSAVIYVCCKILKKQFNIKKFLKLSLFYSLFSCFFLNLNNDILRILLGFLLLYITLIIFESKDYYKMLYVSFLSYVLMFFCDFLCAFIVMIIYNIDNIEIQQEFYATFFSSFITSSLMILFISIKQIRTIFKRILQKLEETKNKIYIFLILITLLIFSIIACLFYLKLDLLILLFFNMILMFCYIFIVMLVFKERNDKILIQSQYIKTSKNLDLYENSINKLRESNHENTNNLIVLKGMLKQKNVQATEYIDSLLCENFQDDKELMNLTLRIPLDGIQNLVYQKLLKMKQLKIQYFINISKTVKKDSLLSITKEQNRNLCTIVGIFLDNAIQEVEPLKRKEIYIEAYIEKHKFFFNISNNYNKIIDFSNIKKEGYSTKGVDRGYGLSIVEKILQQDKSMHNVTSIIGDVFLQSLYIKLDK